MLHNYPCPRCRQHLHFHPVSWLAFCTALDQHVQAYMSSWGPLFSAVVLHWWVSGPSKADRRNFMRTLVPKFLSSCLSQPIPGSTHTEYKATLDQALAERLKRMEDAVRQAHDWLCSHPLPWSPILWAPSRPSQSLLGFTRCIQYFCLDALPDPPHISTPPTSPQARLEEAVQVRSDQTTASYLSHAQKLQTSIQPRIGWSSGPQLLSYSMCYSTLRPAASTKTSTVSTAQSDHHHLGAPQTHKSRPPCLTPTPQSTLPPNTLTPHL